MSDKSCIVHMGGLTVSVVHLESNLDDKRPARFACYVVNRATAEQLGCVLTNACFENCDIPLDNTEVGRVNLEEIVECATNRDYPEVDFMTRLYNFGPLFPGTKGKPATKLEGEA